MSGTYRERELMDEQVRHALEHGRAIDITNIGRTSGEPRRIEIWFHNSDDLETWVTQSPLIEVAFDNIGTSKST
jgi:hypothetical protein